MLKVVSGPGIEHPLPYPGARRVDHRATASPTSNMCTYYTARHYTRLLTATSVAIGDLALPIRRVGRGHPASGQISKVGYQSVLPTLDYTLWCAYVGTLRRGAAVRVAFLGSSLSS